MLFLGQNHDNYLERKLQITGCELNVKNAQQVVENICKKNIQWNDITQTHSTSNLYSYNAVQGSFLRKNSRNYCNKNLSNTNNSSPDNYANNGGQISSRNFNSIANKVAQSFSVSRSSSEEELDSEVLEKKC